MRFSVFIAKLLRRLTLSRSLDLVLPVSSPGGRFQIPLHRGLTEYLLTAVDGGFKSELCLRLQRAGLFPGVVCDVGLNTGQTALELYGQNLPISRYYGFEPNPAAMAIAERIVAVNSQFTGVTLFPWACSSQSGPLRFYPISEVDSGATIIPSIRPDWYGEMEGTFIASYALNDISECMALCRHFFLKIDVEGGELEVLRGAESVLIQWRPVIQCEVLHAHRRTELDANNFHKAHLMGFLAQHGYLVYLCRLSADGRHLQALEEITKLPSAVYADSPHTCDYVFLPQELRSRLMGDS